MRRTRVRGPDGGSVTAETALALPAVALGLALIIGVADVSATQLRCLDAARAAARRAARGDPAGAVAGVARTVGPRGAVVAIGRSSSTVRVSVTAAVRLPLPGRPEVSVRSTAVADVEGSP